LHVCFISGFHIWCRNVQSHLQLSSVTFFRERTVHAFVLLTSPVSLRGTSPR
jgi:hypothetical protein